MKYTVVRVVAMHTVYTYARTHLVVVFPIFDLIKHIFHVFGRRDTVRANIPTGRGHSRGCH
jgi:hypothetical protein